MSEEEYIEEVLMLAEMKGVRIELLNRVRDRMNENPTNRMRRLDMYEEELKRILNKEGE